MNLNGFFHCTQIKGDLLVFFASNEDDTVLDPFNGGGTTVAVANRLNCQWIGIDSSVSAIKITELPLQKKQLDLFAKPFTIQLYKYDYDTLRYKDAFEFEKFIVQQIGGVSNCKQHNDLGLDTKNLREIEFIATGQSDAGIEFYAWDWSYDLNPSNNLILLSSTIKSVNKTKNLKQEHITSRLKSWTMMVWKALKSLP